MRLKSESRVEEERRRREKKRERERERKRERISHHCATTPTSAVHSRGIIHTLCTSMPLWIALITTI